MRPAVDRLQAMYAEQMVFRYLNALDGAEGQATFRQLGLRGHPGYVILAPSGTEVYRNLGAVDEGTLQEAIQIALDSG